MQTKHSFAAWSSAAFAAALQAVSGSARYADTSIL